MKKIYVAGPYSNEDRSVRAANTNKAIEAGYALMKAGFVAFIPHLTHFVEEHVLITGQQQGMEWDFWLKQDFAWLDCCDALLWLAPSRGANMERERAEARGIPVYTSLQEALDSMKLLEV